METVQIKGVTYPITDQVLDELRNGKDSQIIQLTSEDGATNTQIKLGELKRKLPAVFV